MTPSRLAVATALCALAVSGCAQVSPSDALSLADDAAAVRTEPTPAPSPSVAPRPVLRPRGATRAEAPRAEAPPSRLPTAAEVRRARARVDAMTLPELAGQVIVANYEGTGAPVRLVRRLHLGGVIAFSANVTSPGQITRANRTLTDRVHRPLLWGSTRRAAPSPGCVVPPPGSRRSCPPGPPTTPR